jgi:outer membrane protein assembly factor BamD (BamD/ComL family)
VKSSPVVLWWMAIVMAGLVAPLRADEPLDRREKLEYDSDSGRWVEEAPPEPGTPSGDLRLARAAFSRQEHRRALKAARKWIRRYGEANEFYPEAMLLECRSMIALRDYYKAYRKLNEFLNEYAGTQYANEAITQEFIIAEVFLSGTRRKFLGLRILKADDLALKILDDLSASYRDQEIAELATWTKANYYFRTGDFPIAEQEYNYLIQEFPRSRYVRPAMLLSARSALASFAGVRFDEAPLIEAEERFRQYLQLYPGSAEQEAVGTTLEQIAEQRAEKELTVGKYYQKTGHRDAALFYYRSTMRNWPDTIAAVHAADRLTALGELPAPGAPVADEQSGG